MDGIFTESDLIYTYSRKQAVADGQQIDCRKGQLAAVTAQHQRKMPVYMTAAVAG